AVLARAEVLLASRNGGQLARDLEDGLLEHRCLLWRRALLRRDLRGARLVLDLHELAAAREPWTNCEGQRTEMSKSTYFSANVLISLSKQNEYSPACLAVKTKSPLRSFSPSRMTLPPGPSTM